MSKKEKSKIKLEEFKVLWKYAGKEKTKIVSLGLILLIFNIIAYSTGYLIGQATEQATLGQIKTSITFLLLYGFVELIGSVGTNIVSYFINKYQIRISRKIGYDTYEKTMSLPAIAFETKTSGEIINRVTNDTESIIGLVQELIYFISDMISSIIVYIYIFINSWEIAILILLDIFFFSFVLKKYKKDIKESKKKNKEVNDNFTNITVESIRGIREIGTLGAIGTLKRNVKNIINDLLNTSIKNNYIEKVYRIKQITMTILLEVGSFILCIVLIGKGRISLSFFISLTYYIYRFTGILQSIGSMTKMLEEVSVSLGRINEILNNKLYKDVTYGNNEIKSPIGCIKFDNVTFHYPKEKNTLEDFSIEFKPNMKTAIVGFSGEGKTTIFNLLTRIFDPISGKITIDDIDISSLTENDLRKHISIIRQDPFIFNRTIIENFKMIDPDVTLENVRHYCKLASIDDYIMSLPKNYNTLLGEGGVNLSGGQKQRIAIARTLLKQSKVILFDEATSSLDNQTQDIVKNTISQLSSNHTIIIIAHRLETVKDADIIYVIDGGKVVASGSHDQLIKNCNIYKKLYSPDERKTIIN